MARSNGNLDLVGTWEAADIIGVERPRIGRWLKPWREWRDGDAEYVKSGGKRGKPPRIGLDPAPDTKIPKPEGANGMDLKGGPVWRRSVIEKFAEQRRREIEARVAAGVAAGDD